jgi:hypothetical protein
VNFGMVCRDILILNTFDYDNGNNYIFVLFINTAFMTLAYLHLNQFLEGGHRGTESMDFTLKQCRLQFTHSEPTIHL